VHAVLDFDSGKDPQVNEPSNTRILPPRELSKDPVDPLPPSIYPSRRPFEGRYCVIEPVDARVHGSGLFAAGHEDDLALALWDYLPYGPFSSESAFDIWLRGCSASSDPIFFAIRDRSRDRFEGMASIMEIDPPAGTVEIGHIWFAPPLQRSRAATESLFLFMTYLLDDLEYRRLQWKCDAANQASRNAAHRLGFEFEGVLYHHRIPKGRNRDTAFFSILDYEWPLIRENFERWISPENFDEDGRQKVSLGDLNRALRPE
jgi:RimJ/RimL family protein N-acetyltransferase